MISSRLARGLDASMLSPHDRALYDLSKKLWSADFSSISPLAGNPSQGIASTSKNKVEDDSNQNEHRDSLRTNVDQDVGEPREDDYGEGKLGVVASKTVMEVFDQCLREARMSLVLQGMLNADHEFSEAMSVSSKGGKMIDFEKRWEEQKALELDVFARRLRLMIENSLHQN